MNDDGQQPARLSTGVAGLDAVLGGGILPGTLSVVVGAAGSGKTQFGLRFAREGLVQDGRTGCIFDMSCRGDSQNHAAYARRMFQWDLAAADADRLPQLEGFFRRVPSDYLHVFNHEGRRVSRHDVDFDAWHDWKHQLVERLGVTIAFLYSHMVRGCRRIVVDGLEPVDRPGDSIQVELFEYIYHQVVRKDPQWVARDLFRQHFRRHAEEVARHTYEPAAVGCLLLCTSQESMLDDLIGRRLEEGDLLTNANTVIYFGRVREGRRLGRALFVAKHRGSACAEEIIPYRIDEGGLVLDG